MLRLVTMVRALLPCCPLPPERPAKSTDEGVEAATPPITKMTILRTEKTAFEKNIL